MYLVLVLFVLSFLTVGTWRIMQQKNSMHQVAYLEYTALRRHELVSAGAAYGLDFYITHLQSAKYTEYGAHAQYQDNKFAYRYVSISASGALLTLDVYEKQKMIGTYQYRITAKAGKFWCTPA